MLAYEHPWAIGAASRMHQQIGWAQIAARIQELNGRCKAGLAAIPGVKLHTPRDPALSAGICCFEMEGPFAGRRREGPARATPHRPPASTR